jgi:predicted ester cyclase
MRQPRFSRFGHSLIVIREAALISSQTLRSHRGLFMGIPATNKAVTVHGVVIDRLIKGKMADSRILMDTFSVMQQLGVIPAFEKA